MKQSLNEEGAGRYDFMNSSQTELQAMVESGVITQSEYDNMV